MSVSLTRAVKNVTRWLEVARLRERDLARQYREAQNGTISTWEEGERLLAVLRDADGLDDETREAMKELQAALEEQDPVPPTQEA